MAHISIGAAAGEGFSVIRRHPLSVLLWGLIYVGALAAGVALLAPAFLGIFSSAIQTAQAAAQSGGTGAPPDFQAIAPRFLQLQGLSSLLNLVLLIVRSVLLCAVFRAVLHPERGLFGYVRLGAAEFFIAVLTFGLGIVFAIGLILVCIPLGIIVGVLAATHHVAAAVGVAVLGGVILFVALIYIGLRFALIGPMIVDDGKFHLGDAWALTRGHAGALFLVALLIFLILMIVQFVVGIVMLLLGGGMFAAIAGAHGFQGFVQQPPQVIISQLLPLAGVMAVLWIPLMGGLMAIVCAPWARAYKDLTTEPPAPVGAEPVVPAPTPEVA